MLKNNTKILKNKEFYSSGELAKLLGISRIAVFKKIRSGQIKAEKIGRNYIIPKSELNAVLGTIVPPEKQKNINNAVARTVSDYGETLKMLGRE